MLSLFIVLIIAYSLLMYNIFTMRTMIDSKNAEGIKKYFGMIDKLTYVIVGVSFISFVVMLFKHCKKCSFMPLVIINMTLSILLLVLVSHVRTSVNVAGETPVPISFIDIKFRMVEVLTKTLLVFVVVSSLLSFIASKKDNNIKEKLNKFAKYVSSSSAE